MVKGSIVRRGAMPEKKDSPYLSLEADKTISIIPLQRMNAEGGDPQGYAYYNRHSLWVEGGSSPIFPCINGLGEVCPACQMRKHLNSEGAEEEAKKWGWTNIFVLNVLTQVDTPEGKVWVEKLYSFGKQVFSQLQNIATTLVEEDGIETEILGRVLRVSRAGNGLLTKYTVTSTSSDYKKFMPTLPPVTIDFEEVIGNPSRTDILKMLIEAGIDVSPILVSADRTALFGEESTSSKEAEAETAEGASEEGSAAEDWQDI